jgi:hypothetical protein
MASDVSLAVGDGARRMAHAEGEGPRTESTPDEKRPGPAEAAPEKGPGPDPLTAIGIQTLSQAVEMLREDVEHERDRADRAERQVEEGRKRIGELLIELADARTSAMISGCEAAVLRTRLELLTERRPWWRRWFR